MFSLEKKFLEEQKLKLKCKIDLKLSLSLDLNFKIAFKLKVKLKFEKFKLTIGNGLEHRIKLSFKLGPNLKS